MHLPLASLTVVAIEQAVAAPLATRHLADMGARVIKVERPGDGDFARRYDESVHGQSSYFVWLNRGKESITLDFRSEPGRAVLTDLLARADVLVHNLAPGALDRAGFSSPQLRATNPRLVNCAVSGYGRDGAWSARKAYDLLVQNEAGLLSVTGTEQAPAKAGISIADIAAGMYAYSGILVALLQRAATGQGQDVSVSLFDALAEWMSQPFNYAHHSGSAPLRAGPEHATIAPYGPVRTADGTVVLAVQNEREWVAFCRDILGQADLAVDERFASNRARVTHRDELSAAIEAVLVHLPSFEVLEMLDSAGIANGRQNDVAAIADHPALAGRDRWRTVVTPGGPIQALLPPVDLAGVEQRMGPVPAVGEHTSNILLELGRNRADIAAMYAAGVL